MQQYFTSLSNTSNFFTATMMFSDFHFARYTLPNDPPPHLSQNSRSLKAISQNVIAGSMLSNTATLTIMPFQTTLLPSFNPLQSVKKRNAHFKSKSVTNTCMVHVLIIFPLIILKNQFACISAAFGIKIVVLSPQNNSYHICSNNNIRMLRISVYPCLSFQSSSLSYTVFLS